MQPHPLATTQYRTSGKAPIVAFIEQALETCGAKIIHRADPARAPFELTILTPGGEALRLVCYAFLANEYRQKNRPPDEHRFQVKYGSEFHRVHRLYLPDRRDAVTLMFGVHLEREVVVAVDPAMHEWTRFSRSVEFKTHHLEDIKKTGWFGWERERRTSRRTEPLPQEDARTEILLGLSPNQFLRYVALERIATGADSGERLLLVDRLLPVLNEGRDSSVRDGEHERLSPSDTRQPRGPGRPVAAQQLNLLSYEERRVQDSPRRHRVEQILDLPYSDILDILAGDVRLFAAVRGGVAEHHLKRELSETPGVDDVQHLHADGQPDFQVVYRGRNPVRIECKNVLRRTLRDGVARVDFQKTRASIGDPCSRYYQPSQFEVLAACLHPVSEKWEYRYRQTSELPPHTRCEGRISTQIPVTEDGWEPSVEALLDRVSDGLAAQ